MELKPHQSSSLVYQIPHVMSLKLRAKFPEIFPHLLASGALHPTHKNLWPTNMFIDFMLSIRCHDDSALLDYQFQKTTTSRATHQIPSFA